MTQFSKKYRVALFIGRFQPLHKGHVFALRKSLEVAERIIIGIGSSQEEGTKDNPWNFEIRKKMVETEIEEMGIGEVVRGIWAVPDFESDDEWVKKVKFIIQNAKLEIGEVVVVSNNEWTTRVLKKAGMKTYEQGYENRGEWEGYKIRELLRKKQEKWRNRVSSGVARIIEGKPLI